MNIEEFNEICKKYNWEYCGNINCADPRVYLYSNTDFKNFYISVPEDNYEEVNICDWHDIKPIMGNYKKKNETLENYLKINVINFIKRGFTNH
jgi:hypothetical protein